MSENAKKTRKRKGPSAEERLREAIASCEGSYRQWQNIYENGQFSHTQMEICGGQVVLTPSEYKGYYKKVEFYDAQGVLRKTAEATEQKPYIYLSWDQYDSECEIMWIDTEGNNLGYDVYKPR